MQILIYPLRDMQDQPARDRCRICDAELFEYDPGDLCPDCQKLERENENEKNRNDQTP